MKVVKEKMTLAELDRKIIALIQSDSSKNKDEGFSMLFKKYKHMVFVFLSRGLNFDEETAKDLLMDVFVKIHLILTQKKKQHCQLGYSTLQKMY
jgi:hypothetical protein